MDANGRDVRACVLSDGGPAASTGPGGDRQNGSCTAGGRCERTDTHGLWVALGLRGAGTSQRMSWPNLETAAGSAGGEAAVAGGGWGPCAPFELICKVACAGCGVKSTDKQDSRHFDGQSCAGGWYREKDKRALALYLPLFVCGNHMISPHRP